MSDRPNFLILGIDTLRVDHLSCYGYVRRASPNIDKVANESLVFKSAYALGIPTHPAWSTILTGVHPLRHGVVSHMGATSLSPEILMVQEVLRANGYVTGAVDNMLLKYGSFYGWFSRGFNIYSHPGAIPVEYAGMKVQAAEVTERALEILGEFKDRNKPFFLFLHYWDPHSPYKPPKPFDTLFWKINPPENEKLLDYLISQYDGEIAYADDEVSRLLAFMEDEELMEGTVLIITSDHGENLMQHEGFLGHKGLYETVAHVPLIVRLPESSPRGFVEGLVQHADIAPTIYELAGIKPPKKLDGLAFIPSAEGEIRGWIEILMVENTHQKAVAIREGDWKLICYFEKSSEGLPAGFIQLFNISKDPGELTNQATHEPGLVKELKERMNEALRGILQGQPNPLDQPISLQKVKFYSQAKELVEHYGFTLREE